MKKRGVIALLIFCFFAKQSLLRAEFYDWEEINYYACRDDSLERNAAFETSFKLDAGYRNDYLRWSIRGNNEVNILSELTFKDLQIYQIGLSGAFITSQNIYMRGDIKYGWILSGQAHDFDYLGPNRTLTFSELIADCHADNVFDLSFGIGTYFEIFKTGLQLAPLIGYSHHEQNLRFTNGEQILNLFFPDNVGHLANLNSLYQTRWDSVWAGADGAYFLSDHLKLVATYEYHWAWYEGEGFWNLRTDFVGNFMHRAEDGRGHSASLGVCYNLCRWNLGIVGQYQHWQSGAGTDRLEVLDEDSIPFLIFSHLNPVTWHSYSITGSLGLNF
jgi:hypothetical protein